VHRLRNPSFKYFFYEYATLNNVGEPECFEEALRSEEKQHWLDVMQDELYL